MGAGGARFGGEAELMPGVSIHVVDVSRGLVAQGMRVSLSGTTQCGLIAGGVIAANGLLAEPALAARFEAGLYEVEFHVGEYYAAAGIRPAIPFLEVVTYRFGIADPQQHIHLPFKCTPWGYSCFRGGA